MSTASSLQAQPLDSLVEDCVAQAQALTGRQTLPTVIVSPYRFNPLGAHIDHQGGSVLARCLDQYTILCFWPTVGPRFRLHAGLRNSGWETTEFACGELDDQYGWDAMPRAAAKALDDQAAIRHGWEGVVFGTLVSGGLSSSASVILAYLSAMANTNERVLTASDQVELCRIVENDYRGLNNGIQDQMSIAFGRAGFLSELDVNRVEVKHIADPVEVADVCFLLCFSGVTRDLTGSQFNNRVAQCQEAASLLQTGATRLGDVETDL